MTVAAESTLLRQLTERVAQLERIVNTLDREAEALEEHVEIIDHQCSTFRWAISATMAELWFTKTLEANGPVGWAYQGLYPDKEPRCGFRRTPAWWHRWRRPERRAALYGTRGALLAKALECGVRVTKKDPRHYLVRDLRRAGVELERQDVVGVAS